MMMRRWWESLVGHLSSAVWVLLMLMMWVHRILLLLTAPVSIRMSIESRSDSRVVMCHRRRKLMVRTRRGCEPGTITPTTSAIFT